jgi:microcystin-dependent protein
MSDPFVAEIRIFAGNFAPKGWAFCNGQLLPISQNTALFSLLGTFYGGDGKSTFALPDLQDNVAVGQGQSTTGTQYFIGEQSGTSTVTLLQSEIPAHQHGLQAIGLAANRTTPVANSIARVVGATPYLPPAGAALVQMAPQALAVTGASFPHNNMMPFLTLTYIIALQGVFPPRG